MLPIGGFGTFRIIVAKASMEDLNFRAALNDGTENDRKNNGFNVIRISIV
jgi:hypothetical protein